MIHYDLMINGQEVSGVGAIPVINPSTGQPFATVAKASVVEANLAIQSAKDAFYGWAATTFESRQAKLEEFADKMAAHDEELAQLLTKEQGKPLQESKTEIGWSVGYCKHTATFRPSQSTIQDDNDFLIEQRRVPLGVVAAIVPWNFPLMIACWKLGPALMAGNTVVLKTAPTTPVTTLALAKIAKDVFPPGVVNVIADENDIGPYLTSHEDIAKVAFTGSSETGKKIVQSSAEGLKRLTLELGGNDAAIVLDDVDVKATAQKIFDAAFLNCGQVCLAVKRAYVHESIYEEMCQEIAKIAKGAVVGDGMENGTTIGPVQNLAQFDKIKQFLNDADEQGNIIAGGRFLNRQGYFVSPTIVRDVTNGDSIVDKEQFGPILPLIKFGSITDALKDANDSDYGLGASVWSADEDIAINIASQIEAGSVWVNQHINIGPHIPMAGVKNSGLGVEQSQQGLDEYTQIKVINIAKH